MLEIRGSMLDIRTSDYGLELRTSNLEHRIGRRAFSVGRSVSVSRRGLQGSENAGMSSEKGSENLPRRKPKGS